MIPRLSLAVGCLVVLTAGLPVLAQPLPNVPTLPPPPLPVPPAASIAPEPMAPGGNVAGLFVADDYPQQAIDQMEQGQTQVSLEISVVGRVSGCQVIESSGSASLDQATCRILSARARFTPARDRSGNPAIGRYRQTIRWIISAPPFEVTDNETVVRFDEQGVAGDCATSTSSRPCDELDYQSMAMLMSLAGHSARSTTWTLAMRFAPDGSPPTHRARPKQRGKVVFHRTARIDIAGNGKVIRCSNVGGGAGEAGALCRLSGDLLFAFDPDQDHVRRGRWDVSITAQDDSPAAR